MTPLAGSSPVGPRAGAAPPSTAREWADEILGLASPGGLLMRAAQPVLAEGLRRSGAGDGTEWGRSLQRVLDDPRSAAAFQAGMREGVYNGGKALVGGLWDLAKGAAGAAYNGSIIGWAVEGAQRAGVLGEVPGFVPDAGRVTERAAAIGEGIAGYAAAVGRDPAKLGNDVKGWIAGNWNALKADHARAAAQGGAAEARWWGQVTGRATFEVAALAVPVTKFATVAQASRALNVALKGGKVADVFAEAAQAGKLAQLFGAAAKGGKVAEVVAEARRVGRLEELVAEARRAPDGINALAGKGGLSFDEINKFEKAGALSPAQAYQARRIGAELRLGPEITRTASELGVARAEVVDILARAPGQRPDPSDYLSKNFIARRLSAFDDGAVRVASKSGFDNRGTLGPPGGFIMPKRDFDALVRSADGDLGKIEEGLGLHRGDLSKDKMIVILDRKDVPGLRVPTGNEGGANDMWLPGGRTSGGKIEAVADFPKGQPARVISIESLRP